jgi:hypothetical protein
MRLCSTLMTACLLGPWLLAGCGTMPAPPPSPRIVKTDDGYYRDGRKFPGADTDDWEMELVQGHAHAESLVKKARWERRAGWAAFGLGLLSMFAAASIPNDTVRLVGPASMSVVSVGALLYLTNRGALHFQDAVNVYNDDVLGRERACTAPPALGGRP